MSQHPKKGTYLGLALLQQKSTVGGATTVTGEQRAPMFADGHGGHTTDWANSLFTPAP